MGYGGEDYAGKPVIGIINTWSDLTICHTHFRASGAGGEAWASCRLVDFRSRFRPMPVNEIFMKPSPLLYRNLLAMEVEELLRSQPIDGVVLDGWLRQDDTRVADGGLLASICRLIYLPAGPMLRGNWQGQVLGSGSDGWKYWAERCAGNLSTEEWNAIEDGIARSPGHCMTMGTASTMTAHGRDRLV
jgi:dihydroxy-acid dehydratase